MPKTPSSSPETWEALVESIANAIQQSVSNLAAGAGEDLRQYGLKIAKLATECLQAGRTDLILEVRNQARVFAERERLHLSREAGRILDNITSGLLNVLSAVLPALLPGSAGFVVTTASKKPTSSTPEGTRE